MKIVLIIPRNHSGSGQGFYDYAFYAKFLFSRKYLSYLLAVPTLASLTPPQHEIRVFDENIEEIDFTWPADLVGITVRTMYAMRAYEIARTYGERGVKTVLGGIHPSMCPEEALLHCDSVVVGEAEKIWPALLEDVEAGRLKRLYKASGYVELSDAPAVLRKSLTRAMYLQDIMQTTKGCPFHCEFCSVYAFDGQKIRHKSLEQVVTEILDIKNSHSKFKKKSAIFFADDNIIANRKFARELFLALKPHNINWMCQASVDISREDKLLDLMRDSGCGAVFIGFETVSSENLNSMHKKVNLKFDFVEAIKKIQSRGILVHSSFILGSDFDSQGAFDELIGFIQENNLLMPLINILTPFPGTELFKRLEEEGRILHKDWNRYDTKHVVFRPTRLTPAELAAGYRKVVREIYLFDSIWKKLIHYWELDFWKRANEFDPIRLSCHLLFALRLSLMLFSSNFERSRFILKVLSRIFDSRVRISTILTLMAYNDFAYSLGKSRGCERQ